SDEKRKQAMRKRLRENVERRQKREPHSRRRQEQRAKRRPQVRRAAPRREPRDVRFANAEPDVAPLSEQQPHVGETKRAKIVADREVRRAERASSTGEHSREARLATF